MYSDSAKMSVEEHKDLLALLKGQTYLEEQNRDRLRDVRGKCTKLRASLSVLSDGKKQLLKTVNRHGPAADDALSSLYYFFLQALGSAIEYRCGKEDEE